MSEAGRRLEMPGGPEDVALRALELTEAAWLESLAARGVFHLCLAGGSTPLALYRLLAHRPDLPWEAVHLWWGDERCVSPEHPDGNAGAALRALGKPPGLDPARIHPIPAHLGPEAGAAEYEKTLGAAFSGRERPVMDLVLLGLGPDGHTASLFPGSPVLWETGRNVAGVAAPAHLEPRIPRVTLTLPALNAARLAVFLVTGGEKARVLKRVLEGDASLPAALVRPEGGALFLAGRESLEWGGYG